MNDLKKNQCSVFCLPTVSPSIRKTIVHFLLYLFKFFLPYKISVLIVSYMSIVEQTIFDFRFLALFAVGGSLAGSLLCFLNVISLNHFVSVHTHNLWIYLRILILHSTFRVAFILWMHIKFTGLVVSKGITLDKWFYD